jgi:hypothetical protein
MMTFLMPCRFILPMAYTHDAARVENRELDSAFSPYDASFLYAPKLTWKSDARAGEWEDKTEAQRE